MKTFSALLGAGLLFFLSPAVAQDQATQVASAAILPGDQQKVPDYVLVDSQPEVRKRVEPVYPREALGKNVEGKVWVKMLVDTAGRPVEVEILKSENAYFDQATITAARQWLFTPAMKDKKPVAVWITLPFRYALAEKNGEDRSHKKGTVDPGANNVFLQKVQLVFAGDAAARTAVSPDAYLVDGKQFVSLNEALFGKEKGKHFAGERSRKQDYLHITLSDDRNSATIVLQTVDAKGKEPHWHTITWARKPDEEWKITHWHTSR
jgi:TonB family protein